MKYADCRCTVGQMASWGSLLAAGFLALAPKVCTSDALDAKALAVVLEVLAESEESLSNCDGDASFACQRIAIEGLNGKSQSEVKNIRRFVDWRNAEGNLFLAGYTNTPTEVVSHDHLFVFQVPQRTWMYADSIGYRFEFSGAEYLACLRYGRMRSPRKPTVVFQPHGFASHVLQFTRDYVEWDANSRTLTASGERGDELLVRLRSDADTIKYGSRFSNICSRTPRGFVFKMLCPCLTEVDYARLALNQPEQMVKYLEAERAPPTAKQLTVHFGGMPQEAVSVAELSWRVLIKNRLAFDDSDSAAARGLMLAQTTLEDAYDRTLKHLSGNQDALSADAQTTELNTAVTLLAEAIDDWIDASLDVIEGDASLFPDDPHMRWLRTEYLQGPDSALLTYMKILKPTISTPGIAPSVRTKLLASVSALGTCLFERPELSLDASLGSSFEQAVIRSRLSMPCDGKQRDACIGVVEDEEASIEMRSIAAVTLSLLNSAGAIPEEFVGPWMEHDVEQNESPRRRRRLAEICSHSSGIELLKEKVKTGRFDKGQGDVQLVLDLRERASSTTTLPPPLTQQN